MEYRQKQCETFLEMEEASKPPYTTLASTIKNLEKKGYLKSKFIGNADVYQPAVTEDEYKKKFLNDVVKNNLDNSYKDLISFFVDQKKLSAKKLKEILRLIEGKDSSPAKAIAGYLYFNTRPNCITLYFSVS